jgi:hypothetical protein
MVALDAPPEDDGGHVFRESDLSGRLRPVNEEHGGRSRNVLVHQSVTAKIVDSLAWIAKSRQRRKYGESSGFFAANRCSLGVFRSILDGRFSQFRAFITYRMTGESL